MSSGFKYRLRAWLLSQRVISRKAQIVNCLFAIAIGASLAWGAVCALV